jgi:hypothetical protein
MYLVSNMNINATIVSRPHPLINPTTSMFR